MASGLNRSSYTAPFDEENYETRAIHLKRRGGYRDYWMAADVLRRPPMDTMDMCLMMKGKCEFIGYRADSINNYAIHYLHQYDGEKPFFLFISQIEPHHQNDHGCFEAPDGAREKFTGYELADIPVDRGIGRNIIRTI